MREFMATLKWYEAWCESKDPEKGPLPEDDEMLEMLLDIEAEYQEGLPDGEGG